MNGFEVLQRALDADTAAIAGDSTAVRASVCVLVAGADHIPSLCLVKIANTLPHPNLTQPSFAYYFRQCTSI